jgi:hypothetical protein
MISREFDESNRERKERINRQALKTANKLNGRIRLFLEDINKNASLTNGQKTEIKKQLFRDES